MVCDKLGCRKERKKDIRFCKEHERDEYVYIPKIKLNTPLKVIKSKTPKKIKPPRHLEIYAKELQGRYIKSEAWFMNIYDSYKDRKDKFNKPLGSWIPDVQNRRFKYVIEIDGSIHNTPEQQDKDIRKTHNFERMGYKVIRIIYNSNNLKESYKSLKQGLDEIFRIRKYSSISFDYIDPNTGFIFSYSYHKI